MDTPAGEARQTAARALRELGHAFVAHQADDVLLDHVAAVADELRAQVLAAPPIVRTLEQDLARIAKPQPSDGADLEDSSVCPVSGLENPMGLAMSVRRAGDGVAASVTLGAACAGAPGIAHGGVVAALLDDLMGFVMDAIHRTAGYTARLVVSFRRPVPIGVELNLGARLERREGRKLFIEAEIESDGETLTEAEGLFIALNTEVQAPGR
jgi:acyl-coenzyme A thioesterase PaaI-like protein